MNLTWLLMFMTLPFVGHGVQTEKATKDDTAGPYINLTNFVSVKLLEGRRYYFRP
jgi:hypothetical protein